MEEADEMTLPEAEMAVAKSGGYDVQFQTAPSEIEPDHKTKLHEEAEKDDYGTVSPIVIICCVLATLGLFSLVYYIYYSLKQTMTHDADLQEKILSGDKIATLTSLKSQTIQYNSIIYNLTILVGLLFATGAVGYIIFYKDASKHRDKKALTVARMAADALNSQERELSEIKVQLSTKMARVEGLMERIQDFKDQIEKQERREIKNEEAILRLHEEKSKKEAELREANEELQTTRELYQKADNKVKTLKSELERKEQSERALQQEIAAGKVYVSNLETDLRREQSEAEASRRRASELERSEERARNQVHQLEIEKAKFEERREHAERERRRVELENLAAERERARAEAERYMAQEERNRASAEAARERGRREPKKCVVS